MIYFTAHTFKCVCHCRRAMFRVLGMYNFAFSLEFQKFFLISALEPFFLTLGQNNFGNKIPLLVMLSNVEIRKTYNFDVVDLTC